jgi:hypothetical protein
MLLFQKTAGSPSIQQAKFAAVAWKSSLVILALACAWGAGIVANREIYARPDAQPIGGLATMWSVKSTSVQNGKELFSTVPNTNFTAGMRGTLSVELNEPEAVIDKRLTIIATSWKGGDPVVLLDNQTINVRSQPTGDSLRFSLSNFGLPLGGLWRLDMKINDVPYGHTVLNIPDFSWSPSSRTRLIEQEGWLDKQMALEGPDFIAGSTNRYTWYFLGSRRITGTFKVEAIEQNTTKRLVLFEAPSLGAPKYGAAATISSSLSLPTPGNWRLTTYIDGKIFDSLVVEVK